MSMVNPYEGLPLPAKKPKSYWVAEYAYSDGSGAAVIGVFTTEDKAMAGAVKFVQLKGYPSITDFKFTAFEVNNPSV